MPIEYKLISIYNNVLLRSYKHLRYSVTVRGTKNKIKAAVKSLLDLNIRLLLRDYYKFKISLYKVNLF
jgi:hypothetical protein